MPDDEQRAMNHFGRLVMLNATESEAFERALVGVAYWLDCSPHEHTPEDAIAMAKFIRMIAPRIGTPVHDAETATDDATAPETPGAISGPKDG